MSSNCQRGRAVKASDLNQLIKISDGVIPREFEPADEYLVVDGTIVFHFFFYIEEWDRSPSRLVAEFGKTHALKIEILSGEINKYQIHAGNDEGMRGNPESRPQCTGTTF